MYKDMKLQQENVMEQVITYLKNKLTGQMNKRISFDDIATQNCPSVQALKLLVSDFMLHQEYLFTFTIFVVEVPFLSTIKDFSSYISQISDENATKDTSKPHFNVQDAKYILQALGFHSDCRFVQEILNLYERNTNRSFLSNIFRQLNIYMEKYCSLEGEVDDLLKKLKDCEQLVSDQKMAIGSYQNKLKKQELMMSQQKVYIKQISEKEDQFKVIATELKLQRDEIDKLQNALKDKEDDLRMKEQTFEKDKSNTIDKLERWSSTLKSQQHMLEEKYQKLLIDKTAFKKEREHFKVQKENFIHLENTLTSKYEQKLAILQSELTGIREILNKPKLAANSSDRVMRTNNASHKNQYCQTYNVKPVALVNRSQQTSEINSNILSNERCADEEELSRLNSNEKRNNFVKNVLNEMANLKRGLNLIRDELASLKQNSEDESKMEKNQQISDERAYERLKRMYKEILAKNNNNNNNKSTGDFQNKTTLSIGRDNYNITSSGSSGVADGGNSNLNNNNNSSNLTDDAIVEDAKCKLRELEKESENLNKNFRHLQSILTRNLTRNSDNYYREIGSSLPSPRSPSHYYYYLSRQYRPHYRDDNNSIDSTDTSPCYNAVARRRPSPNYDRRSILEERRAVAASPLHHHRGRQFFPTVDGGESTTFGDDNKRRRSKCVKKLQFDSQIRSDLSSDEVDERGNVDRIVDEKSVARTTDGIRPAENNVSPMNGDVCPTEDNVRPVTKLTSNTTPHKVTSGEQYEHSSTRGVSVDDLPTNACPSNVDASTYRTIDTDLIAEKISENIPERENKSHSPKLEVNHAERSDDSGEFWK